VLQGHAAFLDDWMPTSEATLKNLHQALENINQQTAIHILNKYESTDLEL
jgi:hypothetical protein